MRIDFVGLAGRVIPCLHRTAEDKERATYIRAARGIRNLGHSVREEQGITRFRLRGRSFILEL
jgi:hypothetical protein